MKLRGSAIAAGKLCRLGKSCEQRAADFRNGGLSRPLGESCACNFSLVVVACALCVGKSGLSLDRGRIDGLRRMLRAVLLPGFQRLHVLDGRMRPGLCSR